MQLKTSLNPRIHGLSSFSKCFGALSPDWHSFRRGTCSLALATAKETQGSNNLLEFWGR